MLAFLVFPHFVWWLADGHGAATFCALAADQEGVEPCSKDGKHLVLCFSSYIIHTHTHTHTKTVFSFSVLASIQKVPVLLNILRCGRRAVQLCTIEERRLREQLYTVGQEIFAAKNLWWPLNKQNLFFVRVKVSCMFILVQYVKFQPMPFFVASGHSDENKTRRKFVDLQ